MKGKWKLRAGIGIYKGNPPVGLVVSIFEPIEDFCIILFDIKMLKFEFSILLDKEILATKEMER